MRESTVINEWIAEGRLKGRVEARRADLLEVLRARFPIALPPHLNTAIQENTDPDLLSRWIILAAIADSLDAFRAAIQE
jgi:hypothetical protein